MTDGNSFLSGLVQRAVVVALVGILVTVVSGCNNTFLGVAGLDSPPSPTVQDAAEAKYYPSDEPLKLGLEHFDRGNFGVAERYFRDAVERAPRDVTAWVGLAASYDRIERFDLADRAYARAIGLSGETVQILNNQGYSYMLRGDLVTARAKFQKASKMEPNNPIINNNLALLSSSYSFITRAPTQ